MAAGTYLTPTDHIQPWLSKTRCSVTDTDLALEVHARDLVFGRLATRYDVSGWLLSASTPSVVLMVMGEIVASLEYRRYVSSDTVEDEANWGQQLWDMAMLTLQQLADGTLQMVDGTGTTTPSVSSSLGPVFYPGDAADEDDPRAFAMQQAL